jgi:hypothetical protein
LKLLRIPGKDAEFIDTRPENVPSEGSQALLETADPVYSRTELAPSFELRISVSSFQVFMATAKDLRRYPRLSSPKGTILAWQTANQRVVSTVENLGLGGLYIRTSEPPVPGTFIQLLLDVPTGEVRAHAVVQSSKPKNGMGVKFVAMQPEDRARFARWLNHLAT